MQAEKEALAAASEEKKARETAQTREGETTAILGFVENQILAAARPKGQFGGLGRDVALHQAIEAALPFVDTCFADKPLIEARLRMFLGSSFWFRGEAKMAGEQFRRARTLYTRHLGPDHFDTLCCMHLLANSYTDLGRHAEALQLREETLARWKASLGHDRPGALLTIKHNLAVSYNSFGRYNEALQLLEETLSQQKALLGADHLDTLWSMANLACSYAALGQHAEALELREEVLRIRKAQLIPNHPDTLRSMNDLACSYAALGQHQDAFELRTETLALRQATLGPDHHDTLCSMHTVAFSYGDLGLHEDARKLYEETLALMKVKLAPNHSETLHCMRNLGYQYVALGLHEDALKIREETLALRKAHIGADHPDTLLSMWELTTSLFEFDRSAEAVTIIDECVERAAGKHVNPIVIPGVMKLRLRHFEKAQDAAGCRTTADMWEKLNRADSDSLFTAACMRAVTATVVRANERSAAVAKLADTEADRAMNWLKQAVAAGYRNGDHLKKSKDLDTLRDREEFKQLLANLEKSRTKPLPLP
jgi:tetratricopeptide (TPR) repeat protein